MDTATEPTKTNDAPEVVAEKNKPGRKSLGLTPEQMRERRRQRDAARRERERAGGATDKKPTVTDSPDSPRPTRRGGAKPKAPIIDKAPELIVAEMAKQIQGLHLIGAMASGIPEIALNEQESATLAAGIYGVSKEYNLAIDGKTGAALQLFGAAAMVYVPHYLAFSKRIAHERKEREAKRNGGGDESRAH